MALIRLSKRVVLSSPRSHKVLTGPSSSHSPTRQAGQPAEYRANPDTPTIEAVVYLFCPIMAPQPPCRGAHRAVPHARAQIRHWPVLAVRQRHAVGRSGAPRPALLKRNLACRRSADVAKPLEREGGREHAAASAAFLRKHNAFRASGIALRRVSAYGVGIQLAEGCGTTSPAWHDTTALRLCLEAPRLSTNKSVLLALLGLVWNEGSSFACCERMPSTNKVLLLVCGTTVG